MHYVKFDRINLKGSAEFTERWVQDRIANEPAILGLGDVVLKDKERTQPRAGRLDLLLQASEGTARFEVEIQLGATDESHIIRTIEYWDIERKRYPQYDHFAVLVAEDITSRFLNVIGLFNGQIPLIAIQMSALRVEDRVGLVFTKVLDQITRGLIDEDEETHEVTDRAFWESKVSRESVGMVDKLFAVVREQDPSFELKYNKFYISPAIRGEPANFVIFRPKQTFLRVEPRLPQSEEIHHTLEQAGLDVMDYDQRWGRYRIRVGPDDIENHRKVLTEIIRLAHESWTRAG
jgi:hypothetical protein